MAKNRRAGRVLGSVAALALSLGVLACDGRIIEPAGGLPGVGPDGRRPGGPGGPGGPGVQGVDPGRKTMHRLNRVEYNATVQDVLGTKLAPATELWRGGEDHGFDNIAEVLGIDELQYQRYLEAAGLLAEDVFAVQATRDRIVTCSTADDLTCVRSIVGATGLRVFRRPLAQEELHTYQRVYERARQLGETHQGSLQQVLRAQLASAEFLYRIETDPDPNSVNIHPVAAYELASRMSYFIWSSAPDDALLDAAADGTINDVAGVTAIVDRMLDDPKSERLIRNFVGQWLGARRVGAHAVSPDVYPEWTPALANAMAEEMYQYVLEFFRQDRSWLDFLKADVNFVDGELARLYGMSAPAQGSSRVEVTNDNRSGFLGLGGFLALSSYDYRTAPTLRGRWILINLLCSPPKDPPPDVPTLDVAPGSTDAAEQNVRVRLEEHRKNPVCAGCHNTMDPYGIALENFDAIGKYRATYRNGSPIDVTAVLPDGTKLQGLQSVADAVAARPQFTACVTENLFTYALGRGVAKTDEPYLTLIEQDWKRDKPTLRRLVEALVVADTFRLRRGEVAP